MTIAVSSLLPDSDSAPGDSAATLNLTQSHPLVTRTPTWEIVAKREETQDHWRQRGCQKVQIQIYAHELYRI